MLTQARARARADRPLSIARMAGFGDRVRGTDASSGTLSIRGSAHEAVDRAGDVGVIEGKEIKEKTLGLISRRGC